MRRFFSLAARTIWRGIEAILTLLWEVVRIVVLDTTRGVGALLRRLAPWAIGAVLIYYLLTYQPQVAEQLIALALITGVAWLFVTRGPFSGKKKR